ncbi:MAG: hypothetical protein ACWA5P_02860 [bacterium]
MESHVLLAEIRNRMSPAKNVITLIEEYYSGTKTIGELDILHEAILKEIPKAKESMEYLKNIKL